MTSSAAYAVSSTISTAKRDLLSAVPASRDIDDGILESDEPNLYDKKRILDRPFGIHRIHHVSLRKEEMPSEEEMIGGLCNLEPDVDYIISHCAPTSISGVLGNGLFEPDRLTDYLETIRQRCAFKCWYFGHSHEVRNLLPEFTVLCDRIKETGPQRKLCRGLFLCLLFDLAFHHTAVERSYIIVFSSAR